MGIFLTVHMGMRRDEWHPIHFYEEDDRTPWRHDQICLGEGGGVGAYAKMHQPKKERQLKAKDNKCYL